MAQLFMALDSRDPQDSTKFLNMMDQIHVDEKWFFLFQQKERYLLLPEDKNPKWCIKSKLHITKVMFLCAILCNGDNHYNIKHCQKKNLNKQDNCLMYWMRWMKQMHLINYTSPTILTIIWMNQIWKQTKLTHWNMNTQMI